MKRILLPILLIFCVGCVTVKIPKYLKDEFPYKETFYANFDDTLQATLQSLADLHWEVSDTSHPSVFEQGASDREKAKQILIFTEVRQTPLFLSSKYMSLNVYLRSTGNSTDVEIRYISVMSVLFKSVESYQNDAVVEKVFRRIATLIGQ